MNAEIHRKAVYAMAAVDYFHIMKTLGVRQMILQGPPGTSKTYTAKELIARALLEEKKDQNLSDVEKANNYKLFLEKNQVKKRREESGEINYDGQWDIVQFHPSYGYEDFVRGITVETRNDNVIYKTVNKVFGRMCKIAEKNIEKSFFLILDEINRADVATVFGELIYALEYRGEWVSVPYTLDEEADKSHDDEHRAQICVPENLYIIGTMNTADRSVGRIDYAARRRFLFFDLLPDKGVIGRQAVEPSEEQALENARTLFDGVRKLVETAIRKSDGYRASDFTIGHTYYLCPKGQEKNYGMILEQRLQYQILPILREYCADGILDPDSLDRFKDEVQEIDELKQYLTGTAELEPSGQGERENILRVLKDVLLNLGEKANG